MEKILTFEIQGDLNYYTLANRANLTKREKEILQQLTYGSELQDISYKLNITKGTLRIHLQNILYKLGVSSRSQAVAIAFRAGLVK